MSIFRLPLFGLLAINLAIICLVPAAHAQDTSKAPAANTKIEKKAASKSTRKATRSAYPRTRITVTKRYTGTPGYGFLPGYRPPPQRPLYGPQDTDIYSRSSYPWYGWPGNYRGRWNGGGFGPCYTKTPIGPIWNCG